PPRPRMEVGTRNMDYTPNSNLPTIAIVGRPNVGKSTLFNRIVGQRRAIVGDEPGITRDRLYGEGDWTGRRFRVIDTGGIVPEDKDLIPAEIFRHAKMALEEAAAVVMVVDLRTELAAPDLELARLLQRTGKPLFLAVNKVDDPKLEPEAENLRQLGIRNLYPISAEHGTGVAELLDAVLANVPQEAKQAKVSRSAEPAMEDAEAPEAPEESGQPGEPAEIKVAIIGRPNVGKSTLLNALTGVDRAIVSPIPGTTRDAVDELVLRDDRRVRFIDTAGISRKGKTHLMAEKLSVVMARKHMESADVTLLIVDAVEGITNAEQTIGGYAHESGRSVIVVVNKWDLVGPGRADGQRPADRGIYEEQIRANLKFLPYAPVLFISASEKKGLDRVYAALAEVARERYKRIGTGEMNRFLESVDFERASVPYAKRVKIYYMTQVSVAPPTFLLFTNKDVKLHFSYERYLENRIREAFGFVGTPIRLRLRAREKRAYIPKPKKKR
ncbi:MAG TPA: ribosome biogenesis GTPase Der, partial [Terriglobales bacterium]|nr:ribosome biogenesis GTPase Der [Terriglobales bacterium]